MHYEEAVQVLGNHYWRDDQQLVQAAKVVLTAENADDSHTALAQSALRDVRTRMWHADKTEEFVSPSIDKLAVLRIRRGLAFYRSNVFDITLVAATSLFVLYLGMTFNIFSSPDQIRAEALEVDELLLFLFVLLLGSFGAGGRMVLARRHRAS